MSSSSLLDSMVQGIAGSVPRNNQNGSKQVKVTGKQQLIEKKNKFESTQRHKSLHNQNTPCVRSPGLPWFLRSRARPVQSSALHHPALPFPLSLPLQKTLMLTTILSPKSPVAYHDPQLDHLSHPKQFQRRRLYRKLGRVHRLN